ncbi:MAG: LysR family transcriptional regulator, partial [Roseovarius gahaiensis]
MSIKRNSLPPLDTLLFFDSVMRHGSFTQAASELHVTQAAVSKRIRQLEDWLGVALFIRDKPRLTPTAAADSLFEKVGVTLEFLAQGLEAVRAPDDPPVTLAAMGAVSMFWLQPRLRAFALGETACPINLTTTDHPRDLTAPSHDLTVLYGDGQFPGRRAQLLFSETLVAMAAQRIGQQWRLRVIRPRCGQGDQRFRKQQLCPAARKLAVAIKHPQIMRRRGQ